MALSINLRLLGETNCPSLHTASIRIVKFVQKSSHKIPSVHVSPLVRDWACHIQYIHPLLRIAVSTQLYPERWQLMLGAGTSARDKMYLLK